MLCHFYTIVSLLMCIFSNHFVNSLTINSTNITIAYNVSHAFNHTLTTTESTLDDKPVESVTNSQNQTMETDLSASPSELLTQRLRPTSDYVSVKPDNEAIIEPISDPNRNSTLKRLLNVFKKSERREDLDLGLPPDIAHEYIDAVNPPKFRIPVQYGLQNPTPFYITSSMGPLAPYENHFHAGSSVVKTKANYSVPQKQSLNTNERLRNTELAALLMAELDAKKAELDQSKSYTPAPNLFALLPTGVKTDNPFLDVNYKMPNRAKVSTPRPTHQTSDISANHNLHTNGQNAGQFAFNERLPAIHLNVPSDKHTFAITTPNSISLISTPTNVIVLKASTTHRPVQYTKMKIRTSTTTAATKSTTTSTPSTTTTSTTTTTTTPPKPSTKRPTKAPVIVSTPIVTHKANKSQDWSSRVYYDTTDRSNESNDNWIPSRRAEAEVQTHEPLINDNVILRNTNKQKKPVSEDYTTTEVTANKTDYNELDYADSVAFAPNHTTPDGYADYPGANYRLTTERLAYILIGSCCALSILCLIVVAMSVRCRDMCDEYRSWKKAEKAALRWQRHQYRLAHHNPDLSRYFRTPVETTNHESNPTRPAAQAADGGAGRAANGGTSGAAPAPMFGPTCCHCISCSSSWLFRDANKAGRDWCCQRGYYHPAPRGKLPFGAASSVNTFMPRFANNSNSNNCCEDPEGDTDSLNTSDLMDSHHNQRPHNHFNDCPVSNNTRGAAQPSRQQLRRIAQPNGNHNWIHSSEYVDELHKKHSNINNVSRDPINVNNFRARNRQIGNENIVVWNNNNDERLI